MRVCGGGYVCVYLCTRKHTHLEKKIRVNFQEKINIVLNCPRLFYNEKKKKNCSLNFMDFLNITRCLWPVETKVISDWQIFRLLTSVSYYYDKNKLPAF